MKVFWYGFLGNLRGKIPMFLATIFMMLGAIVGLSTEVEMMYFMIPGAVIGYVGGTIVKRLIPDPEEKAI